MTDKYTLELTQDEIEAVYDILRYTKGSYYRTRNKYIFNVRKAISDLGIAADHERDADLMAGIQFMEDIGGSKGMEPTDEEVQRINAYWDGLFD